MAADHERSSFIDPGTKFTNVATDVFKGIFSPENCCIFI